MRNLLFFILFFSGVVFAPDPRVVRIREDLEFPRTPVSSEQVYKLIDEAKQGSGKRWGNYHYQPVADQGRARAMDGFRQIENFTGEYVKGLELRFHEGQILFSGRPLSTSELEGPSKGELTKYLYVMDSEGRIYAHPEKVGRWHHTSFFGQGEKTGDRWKFRDIASAGMISVKDGKLVSIDSASGHYFPSPANFAQVLAQLERQGVSLTGAQIHFYDSASHTIPYAKLNARVGGFPQEPSAGLWGFCQRILGVKVAR